jgi:molecular chaperone GrpE
MSSRGKKATDEELKQSGAVLDDTIDMSSAERHASEQKETNAQQNTVSDDNPDPLDQEQHGDDSGDGQDIDNDTLEGNGVIRVLETKIKELEQENSELKDKYLRKQADFENYRKRMLREKEETAAYSNQQLLADLVTIIDDFERAIQSAEASRDFDSFHNGIVLIEKQFIGMLERKWGLTRLDSVGEEFDPQKHEAVMSEETQEYDHPVVVEDFQKGYLLKDRVLRAAKVKVALPVGGGASSPENKPDNNSEIDDQHEKSGTS